MVSQSVYGEIIILNPFTDVAGEDLKSHRCEMSNQIKMLTHVININIQKKLGVKLVIKYWLRTTG